MSDPGRHGRNFIWLIGAEAGQRVLSLVLFLYLNHRLTVEENGWYGLFVAMFPLMVTIANMGVSDVVTREVARRRSLARTLVRRAFTLQTLWFPAFFLLVLGGSRIFAMPEAVPPLLTIGAVAAFLLSMSRVNFAVFAAHERFLPMAVITVCVRALIVVASIAVLEAGYGVTALVAIIVPGYALQWVAGYISGATFRRTEDDDEWSRRKLLGEGAPIAFGGLAGTAFIAIDLPLCYALGNAEEAGLYALGIRLYMTLIVLPEILGTMAYPIFSRKSLESGTNQSAAVNRLLKAAWLLIAPVAIGLTVCGEAVLGVIAAPEFAAAAPAIAVLSWVLLIESLNHIAVVYLRAMNQQRFPLIVFFIADSVKVAAAVVLLPRYGVQALFGLNIGLTLLIGCALFLRSRRAMSVTRPKVAETLRPVAAVAMLAAVLWAMRDQHLALILPVAAAAYAAAILVTRTLDARDIALIQGITRPKSD